MVIFYMVSAALDYIYVSDSAWERILWHNFYKDDGKIDNIYLGSSHVYCDINPMQLDDMNGQFNFNLSSGAQRLNGSYYLLKEADKNNSLSHVYLELYYWCSVKINQDVDIIDAGYNSNWQNTDYMRNSYNKFEYMLSIAGPEKYMDIFFPFSRFRAELSNWERVRKTVESKRAEEYQDFKYYHKFENGNGYEEYREQGYVYSTRKLLGEQRIYYQERILDNNPIGERSERYLRKIIEYCRECDIPITLFVSPVYELQIISTEHYDNFINQVRGIAAEYGVEYYDFNLVKEEYLDIQKEEYFIDIGHLNYKGAELFTQFFGEIVSRKASDNEKYFYSSYKEKLQSIRPAVYGLYYRDYEGRRIYNIASNKEEGMEYRVTLTQAPEEPGGMEPLVLQDFTGDKEFVLPVDEHGVCKIEARVEGEAGVIQTMQINY